MPTFIDSTSPLLSPSHESRVLASHSSGLQAVADWLREVELSRSPHNWRSYRKEVQRLLLWLQHQQLTLATVTRQDLLDFQALRQNPPAAWLSPRRCPLGHTGWRPLSQPLAPASVKQVLVILHQLFDWLLHQRRSSVSGNPLHLWQMPAAQAWLRQTVEALPKDRLHGLHT